MNGKNAESSGNERIKLSEEEMDKLADKMLLTGFPDYLDHTEDLLSKIDGSAVDTDKGNSAETYDGYGGTI